MKYKIKNGKLGEAVLTNNNHQKLLFSGGSGGAILEKALIFAPQTSGFSQAEKIKKPVRNIKHRLSLILS